jgi:hypothetical protein
MSFSRAKENFEAALHIAQASNNSALQESLLEGLMQMNRALQNELRDIDTRLKTVEQLARRMS